MISLLCDANALSELLKAFPSAAAAAVFIIVYSCLPLYRPSQTCFISCPPKTPPRYLCPLLSFLLLVHPWGFFWPCLITESTHFPWNNSPPWDFIVCSWSQGRSFVLFCFFFSVGILWFSETQVWPPRCCRDICFYNGPSVVLGPMDEDTRSIPSHQ